MIRQFLATGTSAFALAIAAPALAHDETFETESESAAETNSTPTMDFGTWGVGLDVIDTTRHPGDDFDAYVNGIWVSQNEIPADRQRFGAFNVLAEKSVSDVETLIADLVASNPEPGTTARRIVDAYNCLLYTSPSPRDA